MLGVGKTADIGATVAMELNGRPFAPLHDHNGNIVSLVDALTGKVAESYRYTAFGEETILNESGIEIDETTVNNPWRFSSKRIDAESQLIYFGQSYYSADMGRWVTADPLGFADGPNLYAYVHNNLLVNVDPYGLATIDYEFTWDRKKFSNNRDYNYSPANELYFKSRGPYYCDHTSTFSSSRRNRQSNYSDFGKGFAAGNYEGTTGRYKGQIGLTEGIQNFTGYEIGKIFGGLYSFYRRINDFHDSVMNYIDPPRPGMTVLVIPYPGKMNNIPGKFSYQSFKAPMNNWANLNLTPKNYFSSKTYVEIESLLTLKFGPPKGVGPYNKSFFNSKTGRTFNLHWDPLHRGGKPHVDIRKRGLDTNYYKDRPFFLLEE